MELPSFPKIPTSPSELWALVGGSKTQSDIVSDAAVKGEKRNHSNNSVDNDIDDDEEAIDPAALIGHAHAHASGENCHCPIGACLSPQDEVPPTHPNQ